MKRTHDVITIDMAAADEVGKKEECISNLAILYDYVRQSGLYNMLYPPEEARLATVAVFAVGVYLGHPIDWDFITATPHWLALVHHEYEANASNLAAAARALPGGEDYVAAAKPGRGFVASTVRASLTHRDIVREAVDECTQWAIYASTEEQSWDGPMHGYRAIVYGAQRLDAEKRLAPRMKKQPRLGDSYFAQ